MRTALTAVFILAFNAATAFGAFTPPAMTGPVNDRAGLLSQAAGGRIDTFLRDLWAHGGSQIAVLTVDDLGGTPVEQATIATTDAWKLGKATSDNGVLLLISKKEHDVRIEVGQGLEGVLPDAYAKRIIENVMIPEMRAGNFDRGILMGVNGILAYTDPKAGQIDDPTGAAGRGPNADAGERGHRRGFGGLPLGLKAIVAIMVIIWIFSGGGGGGSRRRRSIFWTGAGLGGLGGFGGGGGGGWSGGGGGFSGGGASGKW